MPRGQKKPPTGHGKAQSESARARARARGQQSRHPRQQERAHNPVAGEDGLGSDYEIPDGGDADTNPGYQSTTYPDGSDDPNSLGAYTTTQNSMYQEWNTAGNMSHYEASAENTSSRSYPQEQQVRYPTLSDTTLDDDLASEYVDQQPYQSQQPTAVDHGADDEYLDQQFRDMVVDDAEVPFEQEGMHPNSEGDGTFGMYTMPVSEAASYPDSFPYYRNGHVPAPLAPVDERIVDEQIGETLSPQGSLTVDMGSDTYVDLYSLDEILANSIIEHPTSRTRWKERSPHVLTGANKTVSNESHLVTKTYDNIHGEVVMEEHVRGPWGSAADEEPWNPLQATNRDTRPRPQADLTMEYAWGWSQTNTRFGDR